MIRTRKTASLGEVLAALFDEAARVSSDPRVVAWLATWALGDLLARRAGARRLRGSTRPPMVQLVLR